MSYEALKIKIKARYDLIKSKTHFELSNKNINKRKVLEDLELFFIFCFELEMKKKKKEKIDYKKIKNQLLLIKDYLKELDKQV